MADSDSIRTCGYCGKGLTQKPIGRRPKFCSPECRYRSRKPRDRTCVCGKTFVLENGHGYKYCSKDCAIPKINCAVCGLAFRRKISLIGRYGQSCCSIKCAGTAAYVTKGYDSRANTTVDCHGCGVTSVRYRSSSSDKGLYCTKDCAYKARGRLSDEVAAIRRIASRFRGSVEKVRTPVEIEVLAIKAIATKARKSTDAKRCKECSALIARRRTYCLDCGEASASLKRRVERSRYRARRRARRAINCESFDPIDVFRRDKWHCQACGCHTPKSLRGTHDDNSPELDHVVPLASGGAHTMGNTQTLCRVCNILKADLPMNLFIARYIACSDIGAGMCFVFQELTGHRPPKFCSANS